MVVVFVYVVYSYYSIFYVRVLYERSKLYICYEELDGSEQLKSIVFEFVLRKN